MEEAAICTADTADPNCVPVGPRQVRPLEREKLEDALIFLETERTNLLNEIDKQLLLLSDAAAALDDSPSHHGATISDAPSLRVGEVAVLRQSARSAPYEDQSWRGLRPVLIAGALLATIGLTWFGGSSLHRLLDGQKELTGKAAVNTVVERIIDVESNGNPNARNKNSSATGLGQFVDETWLDLVRAHRPDLTKANSRSETLELRREPKLVRELTKRLAERNAATLMQRGLPVTAGTLYLAHFAGSAGAVAILSAPENADAALVMASADATRRMTRAKIIKVNPFLEKFTVADLKLWATRKMRDPGRSLTDVRATNVKN
jgi:hypothetical protein